MSVAVHQPRAQEPAHREAPDSWQNFSGNSGFNVGRMPSGENSLPKFQASGSYLYGQKRGSGQEQGRKIDQETNHTEARYELLAQLFIFPPKQTPTSFLIDLEVPCPRTH